METQLLRYAQYLNTLIEHHIHYDQMLLGASRLIRGYSFPMLRILVQFHPTLLQQD